MTKKKGGIKKLFSKLVKGKSKEREEDKHGSNQGRGEESNAQEALETSSNLSWEIPARRRGIQLQPRSDLQPEATTPPSSTFRVVPAATGHQEATSSSQNSQQLQHSHLSSSHKTLKTNDAIGDVLEDSRRYSYPLRDDEFGLLILGSDARDHHYVPRKQSHPSKDYKTQTPSPTGCIYPNPGHPVLSKKLNHREKYSSKGSGEHSSKSDNQIIHPPESNSIQQPSDALDYVLNDGCPQTVWKSRDKLSGIATSPNVRYTAASKGKHRRTSQQQSLGKTSRHSKQETLTCKQTAQLSQPRVKDNAGQIQKEDKRQSDQLLTDNTSRVNVLPNNPDGSHGVFSSQGYRTHDDPVLPATSSDKHRDVDRQSHDNRRSRSAGGSRRSRRREGGSHGNKSSRTEAVLSDGDTPPAVHYHVSIQNCEGINIHVSGEEGAKVLPGGLSVHQAGQLKRLSWTEKDRTKGLHGCATSPEKVAVVATPAKYEVRATTDAATVDVTNVTEVGIQCGDHDDKKQVKPRRWMKARLPWGSRDQHATRRSRHLSPGGRDGSRERHRVSNAELQQVRTGSVFMPIDKPDDTCHGQPCLSGVGAASTVNTAPLGYLSSDDDTNICQPTFISRSCQTEVISDTSQSDGNLAEDGPRVQPLDHGNSKVKKETALDRPVAVVQPNLRQRTVRQAPISDDDPLDIVPIPADLILAPGDHDDYAGSESRLRRHRSDDPAVRRRRSRRRQQRRDERQATEAGDLALGSVTRIQDDVTNRTPQQRIAELREDLIRVPGVLIVGSRPQEEGTLVYLSRDRPNMTGVIEFMTNNGIAREHYECQILPWRYRSGTRRAAHVQASSAGSAV